MITTYGQASNEIAKSDQRKVQFVHGFTAGEGIWREVVTFPEFTFSLIRGIENLGKLNIYKFDTAASQRRVPHG